MPYVSFCFSTFKRPDILIDTVRTVLRQTFTDFEVVISDNDPACSGRKIVEVIKDDRIKYFSNGENLGMKKSFNKSIERSTGKYIVMIADDDPVYPDMLETVINLEKQYPGYGMYFGGGDWFCTTPEVGNLYGLKVGTNTYLSDDKPIDYVWKFDAESFITGLFNYNILSNYLWSCGIVKRDIVIAAGGTPDYGTAFLGDYAYLSVMGSHSGAVIINRALGRQTLHGENFGRNQNEELHIAVLNFKDFVLEKIMANHVSIDKIKPAMEKFLGVWVTGHLAFLFDYYNKNKLDKTSLLKAERAVLAVPFVKKYYWKYQLKKNWPSAHDLLVRIKKVAKD